MSEFKDRFKEERIGKGITQSALANILGVDRTSISKYENGKQLPELPLLERIANYFEISTEFLLGRTDTRSHDKAKEYDTNHSDLPDKFTTAQDAIKYILKQPTLMAYGNCDIESLDEEDLIDFANDLLEQFKLLSYKYKK